MEPTTGWSIGLAVALGVGYVAAVYGTYRFAIRFQDNRFLAVMTGGAFLRLLLMLVMVGGVLALAPVAPLPFAATLAAVLILGLGFDVALMLRHQKRAR